MVRINIVVLMAVLGGLAGVISAVMPDPVANILQPVSPFFLLDDASVHPGLLFGLVIALGVWWEGERRAWIVGLMVLIIMFAWSAGLNTAFWVYEIKDVQVFFGKAAYGSTVNEATATIKLLAGLLGGIVGAAVTVLGCALVIPSLREITPVGLTILVGGLAGLLLYPFLDGWNETLSLLLLFAIWQASVGACLGRWLSSRPRNLAS